MHEICNLGITRAPILARMWWTRKPGAALIIDLIATILNFIPRPTAFHFRGFTVASLFFDGVSHLAGYIRVLGMSFVGSASLVAFSTISMLLARAIKNSYTSK